MSDTTVVIFHQDPNERTSHRATPSQSTNRLPHTIHARSGGKSSSGGSSKNSTPLFFGHHPEGLPPIFASGTEEEVEKLVQIARDAHDVEARTTVKCKGCVVGDVKNIIFGTTVAVILLLAGILSSYFLYDFLRAQELQTFRDTFQAKCGQQAQVLQTELRVLTDKLLSFTGFLSAALWANGTRPSPGKLYTNQKAFQTFGEVSKADEILDGIIWFPYVPHAYRAEYEQTLNKPITVLAAVNRSVGWFPHPPAPYYLPVTFLFPGYLTLVPTFMQWNWSPFVNITRLLHTCAFTAIGKGRALGDNSPAITVAFPVMVDGKNATYNQMNCQSQLAGVLLGDLPINALLGKIRGFFPDPIQLTLYDYGVTPPDDPFMGTTNVQPSFNQFENVSTTVTLAGRAYTLECSPAESMLEAARGNEPWYMVGAIGAFVFIVSTAILVWCQCSELQRTERRTKELSAMNRFKSVALDCLETARKQADDANRSKSDFISFIIHELRNPLHAIGGLTEFLLNADLAQEDADTVKSIQTSVLHMRTVVNDALDMAKIESGAVTFETIAFSVRGLAQSIVQAETEVARSKGLQMNLQMDPQVPQVCLADPTRIRQVLFNFASNALKFTKTGSVSLGVRVLAAAEAKQRGISVNSGAPLAAEVTPSWPEASLLEAGWQRYEPDLPIKPQTVPNEGSDTKIVALELSVQDTGAGIEPALLPRLFEAYSQLKLSVMREHGGTGLGLAIVGRLVSLMGGKVRVVTAPGKGSIFSAVLPVQVGPAGVPLSTIPEKKDRSKDKDTTRLQPTVATPASSSSAASSDQVAASSLASSRRAEEVLIKLHSWSNPTGSPERQQRHIRQVDDSPAFGAISGGHSLSMEPGSVITVPLKLNQDKDNPSNNNNSSKDAAGSQSPQGIQMSSIRPHTPLVLSHEPGSPERSQSLSQQSQSGNNNGLSSPNALSAATAHDRLDRLDREVQYTPTPDTSVTVSPSDTPLLATRNNNSSMPHASVSITAGSLSVDLAGQTQRLADRAAAQQAALTSQSAAASNGAMTPAGPSTNPTTAIDGARYSDSLLERKKTASRTAVKKAPADEKPLHPEICILIADDMETNVKILVRHVSKYFSYKTAKNGWELVCLVRERLAENKNAKHFDVILTDLQMPQMNGFQAADAVRQLEKSLHLTPAPIVAVTGNAMQQDQQRCLEAGLDFLAKPFGRDDVVKLLARLLNWTPPASEERPSPNLSIPL